MYLALASKLEMYGSTFFQLEEVEDDRISHGSLLRVFRDGIQVRHSFWLFHLAITYFKLLLWSFKFLDRETRASSLTFSYKDVISTRRLGVKVRASKKFSCRDLFHFSRALYWLRLSYFPATCDLNKENRKTLRSTQTRELNGAQTQSLRNKAGWGNNNYNRKIPRGACGFAANKR